MTIREFINRLQTARDELIRNRENDVIRLALDLQALVQLRIQTSGINSRGVAFSPYSQPYAKKRREKGLQTGYVDFTDTGEMWRNIGPRVVRSSVFSATVEIRARDPRNQAKLDAPNTRPAGNPRGNILLPDAEEIRALTEANGGRLLKYLQI